MGGHSITLAFAKAISRLLDSLTWHELDGVFEDADEDCRDLVCLPC